MAKKPEEKLKEKLAELDKITIARNRLLIQVSALKRQLVDQRNYVGIVHIIRFLDYKSRNLLFTRFLSRHPDDHLFIMAFADEGSSSYEEAEEIAETAYQQYSIYDKGDYILRLKDDVIREKDRVLCLFLSEYDSKEDLQYVYDILDRCNLNECSWMESYKKVVPMMINQGM